MGTDRVRRWLMWLLCACVSSSGCAPGNDTTDADVPSDAAMDGGAPDAAPDPCPPDAERLLVLPDADDDGFGVLQRAEALGCVRPGFIPMRADLRLDCDDANAAANPDAPQYCDFDSDGVPGVDDCNDHDRRRAPGKYERCNGFDDDCDGLVDDADLDGPYSEHMWGLDEDEDGYVSEVVFSCTNPGSGYVYWHVITEAERDCAPLDADVHPFQLDHCATGTDANCDGVFTPVYANEGYDPRPSDDIPALFMSAGPTDAPVRVAVARDAVTIDLCPGTYRVHLDLVGSGDVGHKQRARFTVRGHGDSPDDVVLDAGGSGRTVTVPPTVGWEWWGYGSEVTLENVTLAHGRAVDGLPGGCLVQVESIDVPEVHGQLTLDRVVFRDCEASSGGALAVQPNNAVVMTEVVFEDTRALVRGGAIYFEGTTLSMTGGSFENTQAPVDEGAAIAAVLGAESSLTLQSVDLGAVSDDLAVETSTYSAQRDLGADAALVCNATACTP